MFLKRFGLGLTIALALLIVAACGGNKNTPTPQAATATPGVNLDVFSDPSAFVIRSDTVDIAPGSTLEIHTPTPPPSDPIYGSVMIKNINFTIPEGTTQPEIRFLGTLPSICNRLIFKVDPIDNRNQIIIHVFTTSNLKVICLKGAQPFDQTIRLTNISTGTYSVWFNGHKLGEYSVP